MRLLAIYILRTVAICFIGSLCLSNVSAFSLKEFFNFDNDEPIQAENAVAQADKPSKPPKAPPSDTSEAKLDFTHLKQTVSVLEAEQRKILLAEEETFRNFVNNEAVNQSVLIAAKANNVHKDERTKILARRGVDNILREVYINQLIDAQIPQDYPNAEQLKEYYEQNEENFKLGERVHVWQIFLPITEDMKQKDIELIKKKAESIRNDILKSRMDFSAAVEQYSEHQPSKLDGGYMGLVNIGDLKPGVKDILANMKEGEISTPVLEDDGIHIMKLGSRLPTKNITLEQLEEQLKQVMVTKFKQQMRQAIYDQIGKQYPSSLKDEQVEEWRLKLRTSLNVPAVSP